MATLSSADRSGTVAARGATVPRGTPVPPAATAPPGAVAAPSDAVTASDDIAPPVARRAGLLGASVVTAVAPLTWGTTYWVTTELLPPDRPLLVASLRALPAGLVLLALTRRLPVGAWWWRAAVLGTLNIGAFFALLFLTAYRLPGGVAATLGAISPLVVAVLAAVLLRERLTWQGLVCGGIGVAGVTLLVLRSPVALDPVGVLAGVAGVLAMAGGIVLTKYWGRPVSLLAFTGWQLTAGGLVLVPLALVVEGRPPSLEPPALLGVAWLGGVGTLLAYALWFRGLERLPAGTASFLPLLAPLVATLVGWLTLGQSLGAVQLTGLVLALGAVVASQVRPGRGGGPVSAARRTTSPTRRTASHSRSAECAA